MDMSDSAHATHAAKTAVAPPCLLSLNGNQNVRRALFG